MCEEGPVNFEDINTDEASVINHLRIHHTNLTYYLENTMIIIVSADYSVKNAYNLLKPIIFYQFQQIIEGLVHYEHNWKRKRKGHNNEVSGV